MTLTRRRPLVEIRKPNHRCLVSSKHGGRCAAIGFGPSDRRFCDQHRTSCILLRKEYDDPRNPLSE